MMGNIKMYFTTFFMLSVFSLCSTELDANDMNMFCANQNSCLMSSLQDRIGNGDNAEIHSRPYQESVRRGQYMDGWPGQIQHSNDGTSHYVYLHMSKVALYTRVNANEELGFCGGVLIDLQWVLTAAHCCFHHGQLVTRVQAILGAHTLYDRFENGRRIVDVADIVVHPDWDPQTLENDIALMRLANAVQFSDAIDTVRLPYLNISTYNFAGQAATISGWGIPAEGVTSISPSLREKVLTIITDDICNARYQRHLPDTTICGLHAVAGICKGDNGGPMTLFHSRTEETILVGIASFVSADGCSNDTPSVFTRVTRYLAWIHEVTDMELL